jgi:hypothetical protein
MTLFAPIDAYSCSGLDQDILHDSGDVVKTDVAIKEVTMNPVETRAIMTSIGGSRRMRIGDVIGSPPLHRIADVIRQEQVSIRTAAGRMNITESQALAEMNPACDMKLSDLYRWQAILKVPIAELLNEPDAGFSPHVQFRSCLLKLMRTVRTIQQKARSTTIQTLTTQVAEQLIQMMPELKDVHAWPAVGQRRSLNELGKIVENQVSDNIFSCPHTDES